MADAPASSVFLSAHARYAAHTARACGYEFRSLDGGDGYLFEVSSRGRHAVFAAGAGSPYALNDANSASIARDKAFCAEALRLRGVPVIPGRLFFTTKRWADMRSPGREPEDALRFAQSTDYPIFCKPISASNGLHAEVIEDAAVFAEYLERVAREHFAILAQPYIQAPEYRAFVLNGAVLFSYRKQPPGIEGDGVQTLQALAGRPNARGHDGAGRSYCAADTPGAGVRIVLQGPANRAAGGGALDLANGAVAQLSDLACAAADAIGLKLAGVDVFDLSPAQDFSRLAVIEVNSNPMIATLEEHGRWDLIEAIWKANFAAAIG